MRRHRVGGAENSHVQELQQDWTILEEGSDHTMSKRAFDHRHYRTGRILPGRIAAGEGLRGPQASSAVPQRSTRNGSTTSTRMPHETNPQLHFCITGI